MWSNKFHPPRCLMNFASADRYETTSLWLIAGPRCTDFDTVYNRIKAKTSYAYLCLSSFTAFVIRVFGIFGCV
jgi:hypothetical protein